MLYQLSYVRDACMLAVSGVRLGERAHPTAAPVVFDAEDAGHSLSMDELLPVIFRFRRDTEMRYVVQVPQRGDFVTHAHELWIVVNVVFDVGGATAICERRGRDDAPLRHLSLVA